MEQKLNIAEILKDKPVELKLYSSTFGYIKFNCVHKNKVYFSSEDTNVHSVKSNGKMYDSGECIIFPSKEMRDWNKFSWKKGDVLKNTAYEERVIFDGFLNDDYTYFKGKHPLDCSNKFNITYHEECNCFTGNYRLESKDATQIYINTIEERLGGKLNRETLEVEKIQPEFKDGDIIVTEGSPYLYYSKCIIILKGDLYTKDNKAHSYAFYNINNKFIDFDIIDTRIRDREIRLATSLEKLQLFDMLTKEGKYWDSANKQIVDLKPKIRFKPFDKVVVFDELTKKWEYGIFSHYSKNYEGKEVITCIGGCTYFKVLPFNEETAKLVGTTNNVED